MHAHETAIETTETSGETMPEDGSEGRTIMTIDGSEIAAEVQSEIEEIGIMVDTMIGGESEVAVPVAIVTASEIKLGIGTERTAVRAVGEYI